MICFQLNSSKCIIKFLTLFAALNTTYSAKYLNIQINNYLNIWTNSRASRVTGLFHPFGRDPALLKRSIIWFTRKSPVLSLKFCGSINHYGLCLTQWLWKSRCPCSGHSGQVLEGPSAETSAALPDNLNALIHVSLKGVLFFSILLTEELFGGNNRLEDFVTWETFEKKLKASLFHTKDSLDFGSIVASGREDEEGLLEWYRGTWIVSHLFRNHTIEQPFLNIISTILQISEWKE